MLDVTCRYQASVASCPISSPAGAGSREPDPPAGAVARGGMGTAPDMWWFDSWSSLLRIAVVGAAAYLTLVLVLRVSGKRTLSKLNAFDLVVTVALGSTLATILLNSRVTWAQGATALLLLGLLQYAVAAATARVPSLRTVVTAEPSMLVRDGRLLEDAMVRQRVVVAEVRQALRQQGIGDLDQVAAVVLETDGSLTVVPRDKVGDGWALADVPGDRE